MDKHCKNCKNTQGTREVPEAVNIFLSKLMDELSTSRGQNSSCCENIQKETTCEGPEIFVMKMMSDLFDGNKKPEETEDEEEEEETPSTCDFVNLVGQYKGHKTCPRPVQEGTGGTYCELHEVLHKYLRLDDFPEKEQRPNRADRWKSFFEQGW